MTASLATEERAASAHLAAVARTRVCGVTDRGLCRERNEDAFSFDDRLGLFLVCDGVGGRSSGEVASATAVDSIHESVHAALTAPRLTAALAAAPPRLTASRLGDILRGALEHASHLIRELARADPHHAGMSTTASAVCVAGDLAVIAQVGDSRVYHARGGLVRQLTEDHTLVNLQVQQGRIDPERARGRKSSITRALGLRDRVEVDITTANLRTGDRLLLCTDGLSDYLEGDAALTRLLALDLREAGDAAVRHAHRCGGRDNITALFVDILAT